MWATEDPLVFPFLDDIRAFDCGEKQIAVVLHDGSAWIWGQTREETRDYLYEEPRRIAEVTRAEWCEVFRNTAFFATEDGRVFGVTGDDGGPMRTDPAATPGVVVEIPELFGCVQISGGLNHALALLSDGRVLSWGGNHAGQRGDDGIEWFRGLPLEVPGLRDVVQVEASYYTSLALTRDGRMIEWGWHLYHESGPPPGSSHVQRVLPQISGVLRIALSGGRGAALTSDGAVVTWGARTPWTFDELTPLGYEHKLEGHVPVRELAGGGGGFQVLLEDGGRLAWGHSQTSCQPLLDGVFWHVRQPLPVFSR
ncbi:MAG: hypothetical protein HMLKMBBP_02696 [Planctomycetes bacterium]|nr:hypothetical protein [Planctomycetota bacterium]